MRKMIALFCAGMLLLSGCSAVAPAGRAVPDTAEPAMDMDYHVAAEERGYGTDGTANGAVRVALPDQKLIAQSRMRLTVPDSRTAAREIVAEAEDVGGYVSNESQYTQFFDGREYYSIELQLRIPEGEFGRFLEGVGDRGKVEYKQSGVRDVTEQYIDLEARISNLRAAEERFREILAMAESVEDMLAAERELARLRSDIESLEGQFRYLRDQVQFSTLDLELREERERPASIGTLSPGDTLRRMGVAVTQGVYAFLGLIGTLFVAVAYHLPFLAALAVLGFVVIRLIGRKKGLPVRIRRPGRRTRPGTGPEDSGDDPS